MEKTIKGQTVSVDCAPVHVAPGGSVMYRLGGHAGVVAKLLVALREETAYGMIDVRDAGENVEADIYMGLADCADFDAIFAAYGQNLTCERSEIAEGTAMTGLSMRARNMMIDILGM